jgi:hypothetical protein
MAESERDRSIWLPYSDLLILLQIDPRNVLTFFRRGPSEGVLPPTAPLIGLVVVFVAWFVRRWISAVSDFHDRTVVPLFDPFRGEHSIWLLYAVLLFAMNLGPARENRHRRRNEEEILSSRGNRGLKFRGWPRLLDAKAFYGKTPIEQRRAFKRTTLLWEPLIGLAVSTALFFVSPAFALWIAMSVFLLWLDSRGIVYWRRQDRLDLESGYFAMACQRAVLDELKRKTAKGRR